MADDQLNDIEDSLELALAEDCSHFELKDSKGKTNITLDDFEKALSGEGVDLGKVRVTLSEDQQSLKIYDKENDIEATISMDQLQNVLSGKKEKLKYAPEVTIGDMTDEHFQYLDGYAQGNQIKISPTLYTDDLTSDQRRVAIGGIAAHEETHAYNYSLGIYEPIALPYAMKLNMLDEISANLTTAKQALNDYRTTGKLDAFEMCNYCGKEAVEKVKAYVSDPKNKDKLTSEDAKAYICSTLANGWLKENNQDNQYYALQAVSIAADIQNKNQGNPLLYQDKASAIEYEKRFDKMMKSTRVWGDVRKYVPKDFELNPLGKLYAEELLSSSDISQTVEALAPGAKTSKEAAKKIKEAMQNPTTVLADRLRALRGIGTNATNTTTSTKPQNTNQQMQVNNNLAFSRGKGLGE